VASGRSSIIVDVIVQATWKVEAKLIHVPRIELDIGHRMQLGLGSHTPWIVLGIQHLLHLGLQAGWAQRFLRRLGDWTNRGARFVGCSPEAALGATPIRGEDERGARRARSVVRIGVIAKRR